MRAPEVPASGPYRDNVFAALALERWSESRDDADFIRTQRAHPGTRFLVLRPDGHALAQPGASALRLLDDAERARWFAAPPATYLGNDATGPYFLLRADAEAAHDCAAALGADFVDLRSAGASLHPFQAGLFAYAHALANWQARTRYCAACSAPLELVAAGHRAHCAGPACGADYFPRLDPAVIMIVTRDDACLLGRQPNWPRGRYSTLAGFVEAGESLEDAVRREVHEESGIVVGACEYHSSQPWPFPASLMLGFVARAETTAIRVGAELEDARWFTPDELVRALGGGEIRVSSRLSVSWRLIEHWLAETAGLALADLVAD